MAENFEAGNSLNLAAMAGNGALLLPDVIDFAVLPGKRFWR